ncbi:glycoside hydrolase family 38 C-terminal domain-containing protein [Listeria sp. ILCC792]|uniref:glycoside hydrolase family 38 N-terminal domain-containing protein n=1 Tax=Listeria sp. ILCC792 TaxID=1918331 RepID=UPI000B597242|nr:glycoside hydrolase family 38 C-terminal domain-containing protein [Listeria sp. ILCC792]
MKRQVFVVPHSHWDREWYFSIEDSNTLLSENLSQLLHFLERQPEFKTYTFDGQMSVVEDYLKYTPEDGQRIKKLVQENRLHVGPWYTQGDTLLVQTESTIRNLLIGKLGAEALGHSMDIGYLPDVFGQNAYLPSIFRRFGLSYSVFQRGVYNEQVSEDLNFNWIAPNGEGIKTNNLFFGYGPGKFLSSEEDYVEKTLLPILEALEAKNPAHVPLLLPAGGDQVFVRKHFPQVVEELNKRDWHYEFILSDYESFMEKAWECPHATEISGELIACQKSRIHNTIRSQRMDIKILNAKVEEKLYQQLEPLAVLSKDLGGNYPQNWINHCLKLLFDVHAHDSIGGCNSDETNREIMNRLFKVERIIDDQINILKKQISRAVLGEESGVLAFHLSPKSVEKQVDFVVFTHSKQVRLTDIVGNILNQVIRKQEYISGGTQVKVTADGEVQVELPGYYRTEITARVHFEGFGYRKLQLDETSAEVLALTEATSIRNEFYEICVAGGQIELRRADGTVRKNFFDFENCADGGDSYDFSPIEGNEANFSNGFHILEVKESAEESQMVVETEVAVAKNLEQANALTEQMKIQTTIRLTKNSDLIHLAHKLDNQTKDHRIRMRFASENKAGTSFADQGYSLLERQNNNPYLSNWKELGFAESPQAIYPLERLVVTPDEAGHLAVYPKGLKEYEATNQHLFITLFRSVGLLGRDDLAWRPGRASGINNKVVETPDAQMQGEWIFELSCRFTAGEPEPVHLYGSAEEVSRNVLSYQLQNLNSFEERLDRFELPQPENLQGLPVEKTMLTVPNDIFVSSMKKAEKSNQIILRVFNPQEKPIILPETLRKICTLDEKADKSVIEIGGKDFASLVLNQVGE